jgi:phage tail sheath protein FI
MVYQLSPGVRWSEIDLTTIIPSVSTTVGAFVGDFEWGPINEVVQVGNEIELVRYFHKPTSNTFTSFFTAANYLGYAEAMLVVRAANTLSALNATSGNTGLLIKNQDDYLNNYLGLEANNEYGMFAARYAGSLGNSIRVSLYAGSSKANVYSNWEYSEQFDTIPSTSNYANTRGGSNDEMHIIVLDYKGAITGLPNTVLERYPYVSKASDAMRDDGSSNYYVNVINENSEYIYVINPALAGGTVANAEFGIVEGGTVPDTPTWGSPAQNTAFTQGNNVYSATLANGSIGTTLSSNGQVEIAYDTFKDPEQWDVSLIMTGAHSNNVVKYIIDNIVGGTSSSPDTGRRDAVVFISPARSDVLGVNNNNSSLITTRIVNTRNGYNSSSYTVMDSNWKLQFDKYNNVYRWVPLNGDIAGLCARTDFERDPWFSPAGFNRGQIKNVTRLAWNAGKDNRDTLYSNGINPVVQFRGEGVVLYGDKTMLSKPSAFDRINVRRLFIVLEKAISKAAKYSLFEFNDEFTRAQFVALVEPYLRDVKGRRGIFDFRVVCDETNNTPEVIDRNEFIGDIYIKPARSINFIQLNFVAVRTGVAFSEVVGKF